jgi:membrane-bound lytic murein transglycosylase A
MAGNRALAASCLRILATAAALAGAGVAFAEPLSNPAPQANPSLPAMSKNASPSSPPASASPAPAAKSDAKLEPVTFAHLPGWNGDDHLAAFKTFLKSCDAVSKSAAKPATGKPLSQCRVPVGELAAACRAAQDLKSPTKATAKAFFEQHFVPHRVAQEKPQGMLTGYYEPVLEGSRKREGKFQTPIYKRPPDLVNVVDEADRASKQTGFTHLRKTPTGEDVPFPTRAEIEQGALANKGLELLFLEDPVEVFFMHIQGSGRIHLTDGTTVRINYDGKNGYPYTSIGRYLIDNNILPANKMSMQALGKWLREDTARGQQVMWQNKSFIFFRELDDSDGPMGAMSVSLTPGRSLAVDTGYHTLGTPIYLSVPELSHAKKGEGFNRLMVAQDVGSAIKGPERGDIYFGSGEKAGKQAGTTKHAGNFFVLLPTVTQTAGQGIRFGEHLQWHTTVKGAP